MFALDTESPQRLLDANRSKMNEIRSESQEKVRRRSGIVIRRVS